MFKRLTKFFLMVATLLIPSTNILAYDFQSGGIYYNYDRYNNNFVEVTFGNIPYVGNVSIPNTVTYNGTTYTVNSIGEYAFRNSVDLFSITISDSIETIKRNAFEGCTGLLSTNYTGTLQQWLFIIFYSPTSNPIYYSRNLYINNQLVTNLIIPSIYSIPKYAFFGDTCLNSVTITNSTQNIGGQAFAECTGLTQTNYTGSIEQWCQINFGSSDANPVYYSKNLYINNQLITTAIIPNSVVRIKEYSFIGDTCITAINFNNTLTSIGNSAFYNCTGLTSITLPNTTLQIGESAFANCSKLTSVNTGKNLSTINEYAFSNCTQLAHITIPNEVRVIKKNAFINCTSLNSVVIGKNVMAIENGAFDQCSGITDLAFYPSTVPTISANAFRNVPANVNIYVPCGTTQTYRESPLGSEYNFTNFNEVGAFMFSSFSENTVKGTVRIANRPTCTNSNALVTATANTGYTFSRWSDGNTQNPRSIIVTQDTVLVAFFTSNQGITDAENEIFSIRTTNGHILLDGIKGERVYVSDVLGRIVYNAIVNEKADIAVRHHGVFLVKVGNRAAQKVVVVR